MTLRICDGRSPEFCTYCHEYFRCGVLSGRTCIWVKDTEDDKEALDDFVIMAKAWKDRSVDPY